MVTCRICTAGEAMKYLLLILLFAFPCAAQPKTAKLLGGEYLDLTNTAVAAIFLNGEQHCTGLLVSPTHVLTAAHCVVRSDGSAHAPLQVGVFDSLHGVQTTYFSSFYKPGAATSEKAPFDLGIIVLNRPSAGAPIPIAAGDLPLYQSEQFAVFGFGANEIPGDEKGKAALGFVEALNGGTFQSTLAGSNMLVCGGDSGGPALKFAGSYAVVLGVVSAAHYEVSGGVCYPTQGSASRSTFVDLQSASSQSFLRYFPLQFRSSALLELHGRFLAAQDTLKKAGKTFGALNRAIRSARRYILSSKRLASGGYKAAVNRAISQATKAAMARNIRDAKSARAKLLKAVKQVISLGVP